MAFILSRAGRFIVMAGLLFLLLAGCRPAPNNNKAPVAPTGTESVPELAVEHSVISGSPLASPHPAGLSPATAVKTVAAPPTPTSIATSTPGVISSSPAEAVAEEPTYTPAPTFTPPPPPPIVKGEQLWLQRPVPTSGPAWTDKTYPYGSTRGGALRPHTGVEFVVPTGTPVLAVASGTVVVAGDDLTVAYGPQTNFYGNLVIVQLDTNDGSALFALYGHLSEVSVEVGQRVATGDLLGLSGSSGVADGPHVHLEVRVGANSYGATRNPLLWLRPQPQLGVVAGRVVDASGQLLYEAPVTLVRVDAEAPYTATTSYARGEPNSDDVLRENFAVDDVIPGYYQVIVGDGSRRSVTEMWVFPGRVNFVEVVLGG